MKEQATDLEEIQIINKIQYLGVEINNKRNCFKSQRLNILKKAKKMSNITYSIIAKSCNKVLIGKTYWKCIALPSIFIIWGNHGKPIQRRNK